MRRQRASTAPGGAAVIGKAREGGPARERAINRLGDTRGGRLRAQDRERLAIPSNLSFRPRPRPRVETVIEFHLESELCSPVHSLTRRAPGSTK
jgi:hypothetical protein